MRATANISMDRKLLAEIDRWARRSGVSRSDLVCEFTRKQLAIMKLEALRARAVAEATAKGFLTEEDMNAVLR
jgi:metal-responsive CopG/Arc/MetJ family transcriptional regulator